MPSTIITKNGSGAPLAADLVAGELAVDLTNGRLYTEDTGGSVIEIGLNPSGNVDVTGTVTADGLTVDNTSAANIYLDGTGTGRARVHSTYGILNLTADADSDTAGTSIKFKSGSTDRMKIDSDTGDISFYEDTGTTAKLFWDASAASLGIGTTSPSQPLTVEAAAGYLVTAQENSANKVRFQAYADTTQVALVSGYDTTAKPMTFFTGGSERMHIDSSGSIYTNNPAPSYSPAPNAGYKPLFIGTATLMSGGSVATDFYLTTNGYYATDGTYRAANNGHMAGMLTTGAGEFIFRRSSASVTAGSQPTWNESMRIDSAGNLLVGKDATTFSTEGIVAFSSADANGSRINITNDGGEALNLNRKTSDGDIAIFYKSGSPVGSIGSHSSSLFIADDDTGLFFNRASNNILPYRNDTGNESVYDAALDLGRATGRFKDLYLSGGIISSGGRNSLGIQAESAGIGRIEQTSEITVADDATVTLTDTECGAVIIHVYDNSGGRGGIYFATYSGGTTLLAAEPSSNFSTSDVDGNYCVFKSSDNHTVTFKNRRGVSLPMSFMIVGAQAAKS
jgi:hypothetical protein